MATCEKRGFAGFTVRKMGTKTTANGERKKDPTGYPQWKNVTKGNYASFVNKEHEVFAFISGKISGITVVDCDTIESYDKIVSDFPEANDTLTVKTRNGAHLYFQYVAAPLVKQNVLAVSILDRALSSFLAKRFRKG